MKYILLIAFLFFVNPDTFACSCIGTATTKEAFKGADVVFTGKVIEKKEIREWVFDTVDAPMRYQAMKKQEPNNQETYSAFKRRSYTRPIYEFTFSIIKLYKGKSEESSFKVRTGTSGGDCGFPFQLNQDYLVYGRFAVENNLYSHEIPNEERKILKDIYQTSICTKTTSLANAKKQLKELKKL